MLEGMKTTDRQQRISKQGTRARTDRINLAGETVPTRAETLRLVDGEADHLRPVGETVTRIFWAMWGRHFLQPSPKNVTNEEVQRAGNGGRADHEDAPRENGEVKTGAVVGGVAHVSSRKDGE